MRRLLDATFLVSRVGSGNRNGRAGVSVVQCDPLVLLSRYPLLLTGELTLWSSCVLDWHFSSVGE